MKLMHTQSLILILIFIPFLFFSSLKASPDQSRKEYLKIVRHSDLNQRETLQAGLYEKTAGLYEKSFNRFSRSIERSPDSTYSRFMLRILYTMTDKLEQKDDFLDLLERISGNSELARLMLMHALFRKGNTEECSSLRSSLNIITNFLALAPFENEDGDGLEKIFPPELEFDYSGEWAGKIRPVRWRKISGNPTGRIKPDNFFRPYEEATGYFTVFLKPENGQTGQLKLSINTPFKIWLNGRSLGSTDIEPGFQLDQYSLDLELQKGWNVLVLKSTYPKQSSWKFLARLSGFSGSVECSTDPEKALLSAWPLEPYSAPEPADKERESLASFTNSSDPLDLFYLTLYDLTLKRYNPHINLPQTMMKRILTERSDALLLYYTALTCSDPHSKKDFLLRSIDSDPNLLEPRLELIHYFSALAREKEMDALIRDTCEIFPGEKNLSLFLAHHLISEKRYYAEAKKILDRIRPEPVYDPLYWLLKAEIAYEKGPYTEATELFKKAYTLDPLSSSARNYLLSLYKKAGKTKEGTELLKKTIRFFPDSIELKIRLSDLFYFSDLPEKALEPLQESLQLCPEDPVIYERLARTWFTLGQKTNALISLDRALELDPQNDKLREYARFHSSATEKVRQYSRSIHDLVRPGETSLETRIILNQKVSEVYTDGTYSTLTHLIIRVVSDQDLKDFARQYIVFTPERERVEILKARIYNRELSYNEMNDIREFNYGGQDSRIFYDLRVKAVLFPGLKKGSLLELEYLTHHFSENLYGRNYFGDVLYLQDAHPVQESTYTVIMPEDRIIYSRVENQLPGVYFEKKSENSDGQKIIRWTMTNLPPFPREMNMPVSTELSPVLMLSTVKDWPDFGQWLTQLYKDPLQGDESIARTAQEITKGMTKTEDKIRAVYEHVVSAIRYVGIELGIGGIQPRSVNTVQATRYGDCKDKASLMTALLHSLDIPAAVALVRTDSKGISGFSLPQLGTFNHAVCYANNDFLIDCTADHFTFGILPEGDRLNKAFILDGEQSRFFTPPPPDASENMDLVTNTVVLQEDGTADVIRSVIKSGQKAPSFRISYGTEKEQEARLLQYWNRYRPGASVKDQTFFNLTDLSKPPSAQFHLTFPDFLKKNGQDQMTFDAFLSRTDLVFHYTPEGGPRQTELVLPYPWSLKSLTRFIPPDGWDFSSIPEDQSISRFGIQAKVWYFRQGSELHQMLSLILPEKRIPPESYSSFREGLINFSRLQEPVIVIEKRDP